MSFLDRALELAERGRGTTQPNPVVGVVSYSVISRYLDSLLAQ